MRYSLPLSIPAVKAASSNLHPVYFVAFDEMDWCYETIWHSIHSSQFWRLHIVHPECFMFRFWEMLECPVKENLCKTDYFVTSFCQGWGMKFHLQGQVRAGIKFSNCLRPLTSLARLYFVLHVAGPLGRTMEWPFSAEHSAICTTTTSGSSSWADPHPWVPRLPQWSVDSLLQYGCGFSRRGLLAGWSPPPWTPSAGVRVSASCPLMSLEPENMTSWQGVDRFICNQFLKLLLVRSPLDLKLAMWPQLNFYASASESIPEISIVSNCSISLLIDWQTDPTGQQLLFALSTDHCSYKSKKTIQDGHHCWYPWINEKAAPRAQISAKKILCRCSMWTVGT